MTKLQYQVNFCQIKIKLDLIEDLKLKAIMKPLRRNYKIKDLENKLQPFII